MNVYWGSVLLGKVVRIYPQGWTLKNMLYQTQFWVTNATTAITTLKFQSLDYSNAGM